MSSTTSPFLRRVLVADAALSGVAALAMSVAPHASSARSSSRP
jgi:hypothetical protein